MKYNPDDPRTWDDAPPPEPFAQMLSAAWQAQPRSTKELTALGQIKKAYRTVGVGLSNDELAWLTRLAKRGGWRPPKGADHARS